MVQEGSRISPEAAPGLPPSLSKCQGRRPVGDMVAEMQREVVALRTRYVVVAQIYLRGRRFDLITEGCAEGGTKAGPVSRLGNLGVCVCCKQGELGVGKMVRSFGSAARS